MMNFLTKHLNNFKRESHYSDLVFGSKTRSINKKILSMYCHTISYLGCVEGKRRWTMKSGIYLKIDLIPIGSSGKRVEIIFSSAAAVSKMSRLLRFLKITVNISS